MNSNSIFLQARKIEKRNEKSDVVLHEKKKPWSFEKGTLFHFYSPEEKRKTKTHLNFIFLYSIESRLVLRNTDLPGVFPGVFLYNSEVICRKGYALCGIFRKEKKALSSLTASYLLQFISDQLVLSKSAT